MTYIPPDRGPTLLEGLWLLARLLWRCACFLGTITAAGLLVAFLIAVVHAVRSIAQ